jgi:multidrug resistance efflux pump
MTNASTPHLRLRHLVVGLVALTGVALVLFAWHLPPFRTSIETTENAYVRGSVTVIAPKVDGYVAEVLVQDFERIRSGQLLVRLDDRIYAQKVQQARAQFAVQQANLANVEQARRAREAQIDSANALLTTAIAQRVNAQAQLDRARADKRRAEALIGDGSISQRELDQTLATFRQAEATGLQAQAAVRQAQATHAVAKQDLQSVVVNRKALEAAVDVAAATVRLAEIDLENTRIVAPTEGSIGEVGVKLGAYVVPGTQLLALVPKQVWVVANFKEFQTAHMQAGQPVSLRVDALADAELRGYVERVAPATGAEFSVLKPDNATGNFTKVPQRLPVRIRLDEGQELVQRLRPGMSVVARVNTLARTP